MIKVSCYFSLDGKRIAAVQDFSDCLRMTRWASDGPLGHADLEPENLGRELREMGYRPESSNAAAAVLDAWGRTSEFGQGALEALYLAYWNTFSAYGRSDLYRQMDRSASLDEALSLASRLLKEELPKVSIF